MVAPLGHISVAGTGWSQRNLGINEELLWNTWGSQNMEGGCFLHTEIKVMWIANSVSRKNTYQIKPKMELWRREEFQTWEQVKIAHSIYFNVVV